MSDHVLILLKISSNSDTTVFLRSYISTNSFTLIDEVNGKSKGFNVNGSDSKDIEDKCNEGNLKDCIKVTDSKTATFDPENDFKFGFIVTTTKTPTIYTMYITENYNQKITVDTDKITSDGFIVKFEGSKIRDKYTELFDNVFNFFSRDIDFTIKKMSNE